MKFGLFLLVSALAVVSASQAFAFDAGDLEISEGESNRVNGADITLTKDWKIAGRAASYHKVQSSNIQVLESDNCDYRRVSDNEIQIGNRCDFVSGSYRYIFQSDSSPVRRQVIVGFSVSRPRSDGRIFLVSAPLEIVEKAR